MASTGNHGAAVAYAGAQLGVPARIFLPAGANAVKAARIRGLGATLVEAGGDLSDTIDAAASCAAAENAFFLHVRPTLTPEFRPGDHRGRDLRTMSG